MNKARISKCDQLFFASFQEKPLTHFESFGRLELLGNHTDHQGGKCLVSACSLSILASVSKSQNVEVASEGYPPFRFSIEDLSLKEKEVGTSLSLTKGCLSYLREKGYKIGGFKASLTSDIFKGAGVSSSAAYEMLILAIQNVFYNQGKIDKKTMAKGGQYSENVYFGKPSGLLDQCGSVFGGVSYVDFFDPENPRVESVSFPLEWGLSLYLVNPGGSHEGLSGLYATIPNDMKNAAGKALGKKRLADCDYLSFMEKAFLPSLLTESERNRALHYFGEVRRVQRAFEALQEGNRDLFLEIVRETELSQESLLKNVMVSDNFSHSPFECVSRAQSLLQKGSARAMGGGFFGTVLCFVPNEEKESFLKTMRKYYGEESISEVFIPNEGAYEVRP
ncbi:MAG TPA: galactokinase [Firmicutes bacterium]|nr:galactokinase [Bacillota bacterium]